MCGPVNRVPPELHGLSERGQALLRVLIEQYIEDGQPVGSRTLARASGLNVSAATVRNVMADLEQLGLIRAPHTSAGRVPTQRGFRFFVDSLITVQPLGMLPAERLAKQFLLGDDGQSPLERASRLLSEMTHMDSVVTVPRKDTAKLRHLEFMRLSERRVLAILVFSEKEVQNRILETEREFSKAELEQAANFVNDQLLSRDLGRDLGQVRQSLVDGMHADRERLNRQMAEVIAMAEQALAAEEAEEAEDLVLSGQTNLMQFADLSDLHQLRQLFDAFQEKRRVLNLLDRCVYAQGVQIFIGEEAKTEGFDSVSVVGAPYCADGEVLGVLGVIGPTRMAYQKVIPIVDVTARLLGSALHQGRR